MHLKRYFCESGKEDQVLLDDVFIFSREWWEERFGKGKRDSYLELGNGMLRPDQ